MSEPSTSRSPQTPKQKNREHARRLQYGSPQLQDSLRKKCREKMRERRTQLFNSSRFGLEDPPVAEIKGKLVTLLRDEIRKLSTNEVPNAESVVDNGPLSREAQEFEEQMVEEEAPWIIEEYMKMQQESVMCPMCQKGFLEDVLHIAKCKNCGLQLPLQSMSLSRLGELIMDVANRHSTNCLAVPGFTAYPDNGNITLCLVCYDCSLMEVIV